MTACEKLSLQKTACKIRKGIIESTHAAKCGHPGGSLSATEMFTYLYFKEMNIDPANPKWADPCTCGQPRRPSRWRRSRDR